MNRPSLRSAKAAKMSRVTIVLGVVLIVFAVYVVVAPYLTVSAMKSAAERRDGEALAKHIEFPNLRENLKARATAALAKPTWDDGKSQQTWNDGQSKQNPFAMLASTVVEKLVDAALNTYVTPEGLAALLAGGKPEPQADTAEAPATPSQNASQPNPTLSYESVNQFVVRTTGDDGGEVVLVLRRRGIGWKLTDMVIAPPGP